MNSYSQAGQDAFAWKMSGEKEHGTFLDVGCHDGFVNSNSLALEEMGWTGLLFDILLQPRVFCRKAPIETGDALTVDWKTLIDLHFQDRNFIDYLSLDVDESTTEALKRIMSVPVRFGVITIEHDAYRLGNEPRDMQRSILLAQGYRLAMPDVKIGPGPWGEGGPYEDWYTL